MSTRSTEKRCTVFSNMRIDAAVSAEVLRAIAPLALEAAMQLISDRKQAGSERLRQSEIALDQARYEAAHARRQYDAVDRDNCLVAGELELGWNDCLAAVARLEDQIRSLHSQRR
ncbi:tropomyosin [Mesorhizobium australicum]|uniref:ATP-binding protein n=1 Tax=Mesorhizobium australicum TaxID=536018 RepID=UPI003335201F